MRHFTRRLSLVALFAILASTLPMARPAYALALVVNSLNDSDDGSCSAAAGGCTLREAIEAANASAAADTITFGLSGTIAPNSALPPLSGGGDTISASGRGVVLSGQNLAATSTSAHGLTISSANNTVSGLVIIGFPRGTAPVLGGAGIFISGTSASGNKIYDNYIGVVADGSNSVGNQLYGVLLDNGANNNDIGGSVAGQGNLISGNRSANIALVNVSETTNPVANNRIVGNRIGTNAAGTAAITNGPNNQLRGGVLIEQYARNNTIGGLTAGSGNIIGGHTGSTVAAGISVGSDVVTSDAVSQARLPSGNLIVGNRIGVNNSDQAIGNRVGIFLIGGAFYPPQNTTIGNPANLAGGRNYIAGNAERGIEVQDGQQPGGGATIAGNYIGLGPGGARIANGTISQTTGGEGIWIGRRGNGGQPVTVGPGNVIAASRLFHLRIRSANNIVKGNFIGTDPTGTTTSDTEFAAATVGYGSGDAAVWIENGSGNLIGGPTAADRNVIASGRFAVSGSGATVLLDPAASGSANNCSGTCVVSGNTIQGNYLGVAASGTVALYPNALTASQTTNVEGIRLKGTTSNTISGNVISGLARGIYLDNANGNVVTDNRIGTRADGSTTSGAIRNRKDGIFLFAGTNNRFDDNTVAFNGSDSSILRFHGVRLGSDTTSANNNQFNGNNLVSNGSATGFNPIGHGIQVQNSTGVRISRTTTNTNIQDGIALINANLNLVAPSLTAPASGATVTGSAPGCANGCTVEIFTGPSAQTTDRNKEGPSFLTEATTSGGSFSANVAGCLGWITATVRDASGNTSPFSNAVDLGASGACAPITATLAPPTITRNVIASQSTTYNLTLSHTSATARTYTIEISSSKGWAAQPANVVVPANGSAPVNVVVTVPAGTAAGQQDVTTVRAVSGTVSSGQSTLTTNAVAQQPATPSVTGGQTLPIGAAQASVTFNHTVTNIGDLAGEFEVVGPTLSANAPADWSVSAVLTKATLAADESTNLAITVTRNPAQPLPTGDVTLSFRIRVKNTATQTDPATVDTVDVPVVRNFTFTANPPTSQSSPPGGSLSYVFTLRNTGNANDTFSVTAPAATVPASVITFAVNPNSQFTLAPNATRLVTVTATIPSNPVPSAGSYTFNATAQAVGGTGAPAPKSAGGTIVVTGGGVPLFVGTPTVTPPTAAFATFTDVTISFGLRNNGNAPANFTFPGPTLPAGWTLQSSTDNCPDPVPNSSSGVSCTLTLVVRVPAGQNAGPYSVTAQAIAVNTPDPNASASASATVTVETVRALTFTPTPLQARALPGATAIFTHTLTNTGNATDSFNLQVAPSLPGWTVVLSPTTLTNVPRNAPRTVTLRVTVPDSGVLADTANLFTITARSQGNSAVSAAVEDTVTVEGIDGADLSPGQIGRSQAGTTVTFTHTLSNTGSTRLAYQIEAVNSQSGWPAPTITSANPTPEIDPGQTTSVTVEVTIPLGISGGISNTTTLRVYASGTTTPLLDSEQDLTFVGDPFDVIITPDRQAIVPPNASTVFTHTVTNIGTTPDRYQLRAVDAIGTLALVAPDTLDLAPGQSGVISVTIILSNVLVDTTSRVRVTATSLTDPTVSGSAFDDFTVGQVAGVDLSAAQVKGVDEGGGQISLDNLTLRNTGNAVDTFDLTFEDVAGAPGGLQLTISPVSVTRAKNDPLRIAARVNVPLAVPVDRTRRVRVIARSRFDPTVFDSVIVDVVYLVEPEEPVERKLYLPMIFQ